MDLVADSLDDLLSQLEGMWLAKVGREARWLLLNGSGVEGVRLLRAVAFRGLSRAERVYFKPSIRVYILALLVNPPPGRVAAPDRPVGAVHRSEDSGLRHGGGWSPDGGSFAGGAGRS